MKLAKVMLCLMLIATCAAHAAVIIDDDFGSYTGDINGQGSWATTTAGAFMASGGELELALDGSSLILGGLYNIQLQSGDTVEITVNYRVYQTNGVANQSWLNIGIQDNATAGGQTTDNAAGGRVNYSEFSDGSIRSFPDFAAVVNPYVAADTYADCGYDPKNNYGGNDYDSDPLQVIYKLTKSGITNEFASEITFVNLATNIPVSLTKGVIISSNLWLTTDAYLFLETLGPVAVDTEIYLDSVKVETIAPTPIAPATVTTLPYDSEVTVSWASALGAGEYDVFRATTSGGPYGSPVRVYGTSYTDTSVINETTYYYVIQSVYYSGNSTNSVEASAKPATVFAGSSVISTNWAGYSAADLAGQDSWEAISGSGTNAFNIDLGGTNFAETVSVENSFALTNGNSVYLDRLLRNNEDDTVEGYIDVIISTYASNHVGNTADMGNQGVLEIGLTGSKSEALRAAANDIMSLLWVGVRFEGNIYVTFGSNAQNGNDNTLGYIGRDDAGWNPNRGAWDFPGDPMDYETDPLRISWKIRKTREDGVYQAWASISNLNGTVSTFTGPEYMIISRPDLYDLKASYFTIGHSHTAREIIATGPRVGEVRDSMHHLAISEVSVAHNGVQLPVVLPPSLGTVSELDRTVQFEWEDVLDATGYTILMETGGDQYVLETNYQGTSYIDSPRWNDIENNYTLRADFDADLTPDSAETNFSAAPVGLSPVQTVDGGWSSGATVDINYSDMQSNGAIFAVDRMTTTPFFENGVGDYAGPDLYGIIQSPQDSLELKATSSAIIFNGGDAIWNYWPYGRQLCFVKVEDMGYDPDGNGIVTSFDATAEPLYVKLRSIGWSTGNSGEFHTAIRNGTTWYVSDDFMPITGNPQGNDERIQLIASVGQASWSELTINPAVYMNPGAALADTSVLTNINAIGWFDRNIFTLTFAELDVQISGALPSYEWWAENQGLVSSNSAPTIDADGDGVINQDEYAYGGDPTVPDTGNTPEITINENNITFTYNKRRDPTSGLTYQLETTDRLLSGFSTNYHSISETDISYYWTAITNQLPFSDTVFIKSSTTLD